MDIKIGQKVTIPKNLLGLFGGVHEQLAVERSILEVEQKGKDWIVFRDSDGSPWYVDFRQNGLAASFIYMLNYV